MKRHLILDGDMFAFKFASASERCIDWGEGVQSLSADLDSAKENMEEEIAFFLRDLNAETFTVCLSDQNQENFRKDVCETYKSNRKEVSQPILRRLLEDHLLTAHRAIWMPRLEGDDVMGILATNPKHKPSYEMVIVSDDKDMLSIPVPLKRLKTMTRSTVEMADRFHMFQTLTGDRTDGYGGCPGIGPIKADRILDATLGGPAWPAIVATYTQRGLTEADALTQARLARILRFEDYDAKKKEPILWNPPQ